MDANNATSHDDDFDFFLLNKMCLTLPISTNDGHFLAIYFIGQYLELR